METEQDLKIPQPTNNSNNINQKLVLPILWDYILRVLTHLGSSKDVTLKRRKQFNGNMGHRGEYMVSKWKRNNLLQIPG